MSSTSTASYLAEYNDAMARMYGSSAAEELVGTRLGDLFSSSILENVAYLEAFVHSVYRLTDTKLQEADQQGNTEYFSKRMCPYLLARIL